MLLIKPLSESFFERNTHLVQILDQEKSPKSLRGYAVVTITIFDHIFAIPLHSNIRGKGFVLKKQRIIINNGRYIDLKKGLDYQKAVILQDIKQDLAERSFIIPNDEYLMIQNNEQAIYDSFKAYVEKYINDYNKLTDQQFSRDYKFSTLQNYHNELNLKNKAN